MTRPVRSHVMLPRTAAQRAADIAAAREAFADVTPTEPPHVAYNAADDFDGYDPDHFHGAIVLMLVTICVTVPLAMYAAVKLGGDVVRMMLGVQ